MITASEILLLLAYGPTGEWSDPPAPKTGYFFAKNNGAADSACVLHGDDWLLKDIHGPNYQWSPCNPVRKSQFANSK